MSGFSEYDDYDAVALAELVANKDVSADELLDEAIDRTERINPTINAVSLKHYDEARAAIIAGLPDGPLKGVPFLIKDLHLLLKGTITTYGSGLFKDNMADHNATLTQRYIDAGLVIFGKTNTPEFGLTCTTEPRLFGQTKNPWDLTKTSGGSSGGASSAVAAGIIPAANASDGGGSIRIPAAMTGLFGMKPTRGRTPMGPDRGEGWAGQSISHALSRTVRDNAVLLDVTQGTTPGDPYEVQAPARPYVKDAAQDPKPLRIAVNTLTAGGNEPEPDVLKSIEETVKLLENLGHTVEEARPQIDPAAFGRAQLTMICANIAATVDNRLADLGRSLQQGDLEQNTQLMAEMGRATSAPDYTNAVTFMHQLGRMMAKLHETYDVYLSPVTSSAPIPLNWLDTDSEDTATYADRIGKFVPYTGMFNMTGQPSMSVPLYWNDDGLPIGSMLTGRFGDEATLFQLAGQLERAQPWAQRKAPTWAGT